MLQCVAVSSGGMRLNECRCLVCLFARPSVRVSVFQHCSLLLIVVMKIVATPKKMDLDITCDVFRVFN